MARQKSFMEIADARNEALLQKKKLSEKVAEEAAKVPCLKLDCVRFKEKHAAFIEERWQIAAYSAKRNLMEVAKMVDAPDPIFREVEDEAEQWVDDDDGSGFLRPRWFAEVCARRGQFQGCAFQFSQDTEVKYFDFLFARQGSPAIIYFSPLTPLPDTPLAALAGLALDDQYLRLFHSPKGKYEPWYEVGEISENWDVSILSGLVRTGGRQAGTNAMPVKLTEWLKSLPPLPAAKAKAKAAPRLPAALAAEFPWMVKPLAKPGLVGAMSPVVDEDELVSVLCRRFEDPDNEDAVEMRFAELEHKRAEWAELGVGIGAGAFPLDMRKGEFTYEKTGRTFDACRAQAKRLDVVLFLPAVQLALTGFV